MCNARGHVTAPPPLCTVILPEEVIYHIVLHPSFIDQIRPMVVSFIANVSEEISACGAAWLLHNILFSILKLSAWQHMCKTDIKKYRKSDVHFH